MFTPRPQGTTLLRDALVRPHPEDERFDPDFQVTMRCNRCNKHCFGPRKFIKEAMEEHWRSACAARRSKADAPLEARIFYPRQ